MRNINKENCHIGCFTERITEIISSTMMIQPDVIDNIKPIKLGMTNQSFMFRVQGKKYMIRIPGEGTERLIDRRCEANVYQALKGTNICEDIIYMDEVSGYKISVYMENARVCDSRNKSDIEKCMEKLRQLHEMKLSVDYEFDIFQKILYYESLWGEKTSVYPDYEQTKENVFHLQNYIDVHSYEKVLAHIDAVSDNFLFVPRNTGNDEIKIIDWEYAGMQDPHIDIAMFCIYAMYNRGDVDQVIDIYFEGKCSKEIRKKIYCYISACGLLWSNWCEYKAQLGIKFGEYAKRQYQYAKEYYKLVREMDI